MCDLAIRVCNLSKQYRLGQIEPYRTLRDSIMNTGRRLLRRVAGPGPRTADHGSTIWALKDVSFEVKRGEVVGIIGRNGAGKSTLLKILSRITEPTAGHVELRGRVGSLLEVGTGFHPELTGRENIYLNGAILGMSRAEIRRRFDQIVAFAEIEKFLDTPVKRYSSGMYVRLAFAVAAHLEPEILIVDEVLAVGDAEFQRKCLGKMSGVAESGRTVLFVSHNLAAVEALCNSCLLLRNGGVGAVGSTEAVIAQYLTSDQEPCYDVDLWNHPGRLPGKQRILRRLRLLDDGGRVLRCAELGRPLTFELELMSENRLANVVAAIHIYSSLGQRVVSYHSRYQAPASIALEGTTILRCRTPMCQLMPGEYSLVLGVDSGQDTVDRIESGLHFEVAPRDVYGTGRVPSSRQGVYVPQAEWSASSAS
ncbi:ABC transporter ATP-binding protein [Fontivita pretiosa]|uniref:ABC transporter ATP-binding protein n=1 Tax=Fontivita pretiosa TaxID=2989684 RepID=UPI003D17BF8F